MDYGVIAGGVALIVAGFNVVKGANEYNKTQREAGAKEEKDKQRDEEIKRLNVKITEMDDVKKELAEVKHSVDLLKSGLEGSIKILTDKIAELVGHIEKGIK